MDDEPEGRADMGIVTLRTPLDPTSVALKLKPTAPLVPSRTEGIATVAFPAKSITTGSPSLESTVVVEVNHSTVKRIVRCVSDPLTVMILEEADDSYPIGVTTEKTKVPF